MRHAKNDDILILPCLISGPIRLIATVLLNLNHERLLKPAARLKFG